MALIYDPRLSTPEPLDVPRWDDAVPETVPTSLPTLGLSLGLPRLSLDNLRNFTTTQASEPTETAKVGAGTAATKQGGSGAYKGTTGLPEQRGSAPYGFQPNMWADLGAMNAAMKAAGLGTFTITDGWRSYDAQVALKKKKPGLAARPGTSRHGLGIAADLGLTSRQAKWVRQNANRFGLNVPMPSKEPWHLEAL